jgi:hypothetical protein
MPEGAERDQGAPVEAGPLLDRIVIAEGQEAPSGIAVDDTFVYFANRDGGTIVRCSHQGCGADPELVVSDQDSPISLSMDATHLYWVTGWREGDVGGPASRPVFRCDLSACEDTIEPLDSGPYQPYGIAVIGDRVYLAAWPSLASCPKDGCSTGATVTLGSGPFVSLDVDDSWLYTAKFGQSQVERCPLTGCANGPPLFGNVMAMSVVVDAERAYVADYDFFRWQPQPGGGIRQPKILSCPIDGCAAPGPVEVETGEISPYALAEHGDRLYFTNIEHGSVVSVRK